MLYVEILQKSRQNCKRVRENFILGTDELKTPNSQNCSNHNLPYFRKRPQQVKWWYMHFSHAFSYCLASVRNHNAMYSIYLNEPFR